MMITLEKQHFIGKGANRECYVNPDSSKECIKLILKNRANVENKIDREIKESERLERKAYNLSRISRYRREVETNFGKGFVFDLICDKDGTISRTLKDYFYEQVESDFTRGDYLRLLNELYIVCKENHYILCDLHENNVVLQRLESEDRLVIIDGLGNFDFIKICDWSKWLAQKKLDRKFNRFLKRLKISKSELAL